MPEGRPIPVFKELVFNDELGCGRPEYRFCFLVVVVATRDVVLVELPRRLEAPKDGVDRLALLPPVKTTEDAGELPGVSTTLPVKGLSAVTMLEIESRSCCWDRPALSSSNIKSIVAMLCLRASDLAVMSESNLKISPFTVSRSLIPFWMITKTLSIAGT